MDKTGTNEGAIIAYPQATAVAAPCLHKYDIDDIRS
jgi:hypothetical protein